MNSSIILCVLRHVISLLARTHKNQAGTSAQNMVADSAYFSGPNSLLNHSSMLQVSPLVTLCGSLQRNNQFTQIPQLHMQQVAEDGTIDQLYFAEQVFKPPG